MGCHHINLKLDFGFGLKNDRVVEDKWQIVPLLNN